MIAAVMSFTIDFMVLAPMVVFVASWSQVGRSCLSSEKKVRLRKKNLVERVGRDEFLVKIVDVGNAIAGPAHAGDDNF
jgi:hypothetical protein